MCGIVGMTVTAGAARLAAVEAVRRMASTIVHRGPDDEGVHADEHVVLGMRRLSIIDLSGGHQPICNEDETLWVVCNGEIYNFQGVRADLQRRGHRFRTGSDVEVHRCTRTRSTAIASSITSPACSPSRCGTTRRSRLILARDRLGIKPLYYTHRSTASSPSARRSRRCWRCRRCRRGVDRDALRDYLTLGYCRRAEHDFRRHPQAAARDRAGLGRARGCAIETLLVSRRIASTQIAAAKRTGSSCMRSELKRAVREHMVSDVPIGAFLSAAASTRARSSR